MIDCSLAWLCASDTKRQVGALSTSEKVNVIQMLDRRERYGLRQARSCADDQATTSSLGA
jgi:hypothetical protein